MPIIEISLWGSLCRPMPSRLRCSRTTASAKLLAAAPAELLGQRVAPQPRPIGALHHPLEQRLPVGARDAAGLEVGARVLAPVVEEAGVVALGFERADLAPR